MNTTTFRKCLTISLAIHLFIGIMLNFLCLQKRIDKKFVVYGAHSSKIGKTIYKRSRSHIIPIAQSGSSKKMRSKNNKKKAIAKKKRTKKNISINKKQSLKKTISAKSKKTTKAFTKKQRKTNPAKTKKPTIIPAQKQPPAIEQVAPPEITPEEKVIIPEDMETPVPTEALTELLVTNTTQQIDAIISTDIPSLNEAATEEECIDSYDFTNETTEQLEPLKILVRSEIERVWHPSIGIPRNTEAIVELTIDKIGKIVAHTFLQKSKILIYDKSIIMALSAMSFPLQLYDKKIIIRFKQ